MIFRQLFFVALASLSVTASADSLDETLQTHLTEADLKRIAAREAKRISSKLEGKSAQDVFSKEILEALSGAQGRDATSRFSLAAAAEIYANVTTAVRGIVENETPDITELVQALLFTTVLIMVTEALAQLEASLNPVPEYREDYSGSDGSPVRYHNIVHENWANVLGNQREIRTYYPVTRTGVVNIVKKARRERARVRASGLRHSWSHWAWGVDSVYETIEENPCYRWGQTGDVDYYIGMVPYELSNYLYFVRANLSDWQSRSTELSAIEGPMETWTDPDGSEYASVRVGASALSQFVMEWGIENGWTLPSIPATPEFTIAGVVSTFSHGGGRNFKPVSDYVIAMEYVDERGKIQYVDDPYELDATAGSLGLFGVVLSVTLKMNRMTFANYIPVSPVFQPGEQYFPRPPEPFPQELIDKIENNYFSSFYFAMNHGNLAASLDIFEQFWDDDGAAADAAPIYGGAVDAYQQRRRYLDALLEAIFKDELDSAGSRDTLSFLSLATDRNLGRYIGANSPSSNVQFPVTTPVAQALLDLRGGHSLRVRNFEIEIPLRGDAATGNPDYTTISEIYWIYQDVVNNYERYGIYPHDFAAEFRILSNSTRLLSPFYGNPYGTATITASATVVIPIEIWNQFKADMAFRFERFDTGSGVPKPRFHLGKEMPVSVTGIGPASVDYFRETYGEQIDLFKARYESIVESRGSRVRDSLERFSTKYFDQVLLDCPFPRPKCNRGPWWNPWSDAAERI